MRVVVFILTALIQAAAAVLIFFMLLLGLNGFSEGDALPSLVFFIGLGVLSPLTLSGLAAYASKRIAEKKSMGGFAASAFAVVCFSVLGVMILAGGFIVALVIASIMHDWK